MRRALLAGFLVCIALYAVPTRHEAMAGEPNALGCIFAADGGSLNNATTGYGCAGCPPAFAIGTSRPITLQCMTGTCSVAVGSVTTSASTLANTGLYLSALEKITSSTGSLALANVALPDGGTYRGGVVSLAQASSTAATLCVFGRLGNE